MAKDRQFLDDTERGAMPFLFSDHRKVEQALEVADAASPKALARLREATE